MHVILCHTTADFDTLGAAVGLAWLQPGSKVVITGGCHPAVQDFLALYRDEYPLLERRSVTPETITQVSVVDTQDRDRLGKAAEWLDQPGITIRLYDHHLEAACSILATDIFIEAVGATTTLIAERLQAEQIELSPMVATVMALGIHVDTGSLTFDHSTSRDALALAWLMQQGAHVPTIAAYADPGLSPQLHCILSRALDQVQLVTIAGCQLVWVLLELDDSVQGLSAVASRLVDLTNSDVLLFAAQYPTATDEVKVTIVARSRLEGVNLNQLLSPLGGGGHPRAAAVTLRTTTPQAVLMDLVSQVQQVIPSPPLAKELMSSPVRTIRPETTIDQAQRILLRYGHSGLSVVDDNHDLVGIISRRDLDIALHHGFGHAPVKGYMSLNPKTINPETPLPTIEALMITYDIGRLPVLSQGQLVGIVTRTDVLRHRHNGQLPGPSVPIAVMAHPMDTVLRQGLDPHLWDFLTQAAHLAQQWGWHLYLIGGAVRDLLLSKTARPINLQDIDLVVDGCHHSMAKADDSSSAAMQLAEALRQKYPDARLNRHGQFQTAALLWHNHPTLGSLWVDIATARTEFYPYPAANPQVEASSIRQDLYRRDFTINALAVKLTGTLTMPLIDFFGGQLDLQAKLVRVLHANSFIEDPTRIYRAVRFAVRLGFQIEARTEDYIRYALVQFSAQMPHLVDQTSSDRRRVPALETRLKSELKYILQAPYWRAAVKQLGSLDAFQCLHPTLALDTTLWKQLCLIDRIYHRLGSSDHPWIAESLPPLWELLLETLIAYVAPPYRGIVSRNLQCSADTIQRLDTLEQTQIAITQGLALDDRPSQIVNRLQPYDTPTLVLVGVRSARPIRNLLWRYLSQWSHTKPPLDGNDLKALGYQPGQAFRTILEALLMATLDGTIVAAEADQQRQQALQFLQAHYPLS